MNELTEQLKLSKIADAEIGERIKAVVYLIVHIYCFAYVCGQTLKNFINTPTTEQTELWQGLFPELKKWTRLLSSGQLKTTEQPSNLQHNKEESISLNSSEVYSSESVSLHQPVTTKQTRRSKPVGFA